MLKTLNKVAGAAVAMFVYPVKSLLINLVLIIAMLASVAIFLAVLTIIPIFLFAAGILLILTELDPLAILGAYALLASIVAMLIGTLIGFIAVAATLVVTVVAVACTIWDIGVSIYNGCTEGFELGLISQPLMKRIILDIFDFSTLAYYLYYFITDVKPENRKLASRRVEQTRPLGEATVEQTTASSTLRINRSLDPIEEQPTSLAGAPLPKPTTLETNSVKSGGEVNLNESELPKLREEADNDSSADDGQNECKKKPGGGVSFQASLLS